MKMKLMPEITRISAIDGGKASRPVESVKSGRITNLALFLCVLAFGANSHAEDALQTKAKMVADRFHEQMDLHGIVGGSLAVFQADGTLLEEHHGMASQERQSPASADTIYAWGSITKTLTSIAIMQLDLRNVLRISDSYVDYVPEFRKIQNPFHNTSDISIRMLMSHTAGLQSASFIAPMSTFEPGPRWEQIEAVMNYYRVLNEPGTKFQYSNLSLMLVGRLIDEVTLDEYETYMDKNLFKPLGMHKSYFDTTPYHLFESKAQGYFAREEGKERRLFHPDYDQGVTTSNGGLKTSLNEMKKYARFLLGTSDSAVQEKYDQVLPREVLESMWVPVLPFEDADSRGIGLGFWIIRNFTHDYIGHYGGGNGFRAWLLIEPESNTAILMAANTENSGAVFDAVAKTIDEELVPVLQRQKKSH